MDREPFEPSIDASQEFVDDGLGTRATHLGPDFAGQAMRARLESRLFPDLEPCSIHPRIGRYEVLRRVGVGGMGEVFEAFDPQLQRSVALKVLHADLSERCRYRLRREATALAQLSHPSIVHVYEVGEVDEVVYLAMEFIPGPTLAVWQESPNVSWRAVLEMYLAAAAALDTAHRAGIIHRDFKPSNVMVRPDGRVCVLDFGLARAIDYEEPPNALALDSPGGLDHEDSPTLLSERLTVTGSTMGTPAYMSPEQMMAQPVNAASDQFSFCAALWEALYGDRPYAGKSIPELLRSLVLEEMRSPAHAPWRPPWLRHALMRGLQLKPEKRYPSMAALVDALSTTPRRRRQWAGGTLIAAMVFGGTSMALWPSTPPCPDAETRIEGLLGPEAREARRRAFKNTDVTSYGVALATAESRLSETSARWSDAYTSVCETLAQPSPPARAHGELACLDRALSEIQATADALSRADATTLRRLPWVLSGLDRSRRCEGDVEQGSGTPDRETRALLSEVAARLASGDLDGAAIGAERARVRAAGQGDHAAVGEALRWSGKVAAEREAYQEAQPLLQAAVQKSVLASDAATSVDASLDLAEVYAKRGETDRALDAVAQAEALLPQIDPGHGPRAARVASTRGLVAALAGRPEDAQVALTTAKVLTIQLFGEQSLEHAQILKVMGDALADMGQLALAHEHYTRARATAVSLLGDDFPFVAAIDYELGTLALARGRLDDAERSFERAQAVYAQAEPDFVGARAIVLTAQANVQLEAERYAEAIQTTDAVEELLTRHGEARHRTRIPAWTIRLAALVAQTRFEDALGGYFFLLGLVEAEGDLARLGPIHANVADLMVQMGRPADARAHLEGSLPRLAARLGRHALPLAHLHHSRSTVALVLDDIETARAALQDAEACLARAAADDPESLLPRALVSELRLRIANAPAPSHLLPQ